jgi:PDZ domain
MNQSHSTAPIERSQHRPSPRYIGLLVSIALLVLLVGGLLRPQAEPVNAVPTNELVTLPELSQRRMLRDIATYVGERAGTFASSVVYLPAEGASGLVVGPDSVLSASGGPHPWFLLTESPESLSHQDPVKVLNVDTLPPRWVLVVGRSADRRPLAIAGLTGGVVPLQCAELPLRELLLDAVVPQPLQGGGVFDLDGNALALAVPCDQRIALVPIGDALRAIEQQRTPEHRLWRRYGLRAVPGDSGLRRVLGAREGLIVTEVRLGGAADRAGIWPGDVLLTSRLDSFPGALQVRRGSSMVRVTLSPDTTSAATSQPLIQTAGITLGTVEPGSRAARAGLQSGDRVLRIGVIRRPTPEAVSRALAAGPPTFLVYERGGRRRGVMLP